MYIAFCTRIDEKKSFYHSRVGRCKRILYYNLWYQVTLNSFFFLISTVDGLHLLLKP